MPLFNNTNFKNRYEIVGSFGIIMVVILVVGLIGTGGISRISEDIRDMFYDRLYPAVEMAKITEKLYENRLNLEEHLMSLNKGKMQLVEQSILKNNQLIDSLVEKYAGTDLVDEESNNLLLYRQEIFKYRKIENRILSLSRNNKKTHALQVFSNEGFEEFKRMMEPIHKITDAQITIGKELYDDSVQGARSVRLALYIAMVIVVLVGLVLGVAVSFRYLNE